MSVAATATPIEAASVGRAIPPQLYAFTAALGGATQGFITVALGYVLASRGFPIAAIATLVALRLLPETWRIVFGPLLDISLNPRLWFFVAAAGSAICTLGFSLVPLQQQDMWVLEILTLAVGVFSNLTIVAQTAAIAVTADPRVRGRIAGWSQGGNLAGLGIGGGIGLWLTSHVGLTAAAAAIALWALVCAWPMLIIRTPRPAAVLPLRVVGKELAGEVLTLASSRSGLLAILAVTLPMGLGSFLGLLSSVSSEWHASADLTASTTGALAGLASVPGCLIGGYLCDRHPPQIVLAWTGLGCALGEAVMALAPRTPWCFVTFALLNNLLLGFAWAAVAAVIYASVKPSGGGTIGALLGSLCNLPVVIMTLVLGASAARHGVTGMMGIEATMGAMSAVVYGLAAWLWRPRAALTAISI